MSNEETWRDDLINLLKKDLSDIHHEFSSRNIIRDVYYYNDTKSRYLQLGLFNQDIVIWDNDENLNILGFEKIKGIKFHNLDLISKNTSELIIPKIIIELKYNGANTHTLLTYSKISFDIKSIYPNSKYFLLMLYSGNSSNNKLLRNGVGFDKIMYFIEGKAREKEYMQGIFNEMIDKNFEIRKKYKAIVDLIRNAILFNDEVSIK
jgi:hypothetical protein